MNPKNAPNLLEAMTDDIRSQEAIYQPTAFWSKASSDIYADLVAHGFQNFRALPSALSYFVPTYGPPGNSLTVDETRRIEETLLATAKLQSKKHSTLMHMISGEMWALADYRVSIAGDDVSQAPNLTKVSESKVGNPREHFCFEERWFSRSFLNYILGITFLKQHVETAGIKRVIEVGGG